MNLLEIVKKLDSSFDHIERSPVIDREGNTVGWNCFFYGRNGDCLGGGTAHTQDQALRIGIAECIERAVVMMVHNNDRLSHRFLTDQFPGASGFAAGFEDIQTRKRSIAEGIERWIWSKWIDDGLGLTSGPQVDKFTPLASQLLKSFDSVRLYSARIFYRNVELQFGALLGFKDNGVFPGSRVCTMTEDPWEHSAIEANRNYANYCQMINTESSNSERDIIQKRVQFFGDHRNVALGQIPPDVKERSFRVKEPLISERVDLPFGGVRVYRTIFGGYIPWSEGAVDRFVY